MANQLGWALVGMPANFVPIMYYEIAFLSERQQLNITSQYFLRRVEIKCQGFLDLTRRNNKLYSARYIHEFIIVSLGSCYTVYIYGL